MMKINLKCVLLAFLLLGGSVMANAGNGIKRSEWDFRPEITTGNVAYFLPAYAASLFIGQKIMKREMNSSMSGEDVPLWFPQIGFRYTFIGDVSVWQKEIGKSSLDLTETKANILDWTNPDFSIGYSVNYTSKQIPFGFRVKLAYDHQSFKAKQKATNDWTTFSKEMIVPEVVLKILFGSYRTSGTMVSLNVGASYDYVISAKNIYKDKKTVNNGFSGIIGFDFAHPSEHIQIGVNYIHPFYDYFNSNFTPDNGGTYPYKDSKAKLSRMEVFLRYGF